MRLIDADTLASDLTRFYEGEVTARKLIAEQPTIDAVPVAHAKWVMTEFVSEDTGIWWSWHCSNCGEKYLGLGKLDVRQHKYCPNCGARMDGGERDGTVD